MTCMLTLTSYLALWQPNSAMINMKPKTQPDKLFCASRTKLKRLAWMKYYSSLNVRDEESKFYVVDTCAS
jgi:hypothetical protein